MKIRKSIFLFLLLIFVLPSLACKLPFWKDQPETVDPGILPGYAVYNNGIVEIVLPDTYQERDIRADIPIITKALEFFGSSGLGVSVESIVDELLKNTVFWAVDGDIEAEETIKLLILKNKLLANVPLGMIGSSIETLFRIPDDQFDTETMKLGEYDVVRLTLYHKESSEAIYALKDESLLWLIIFISTPDQMPLQLSSFEDSVATFKVISIPLED